MYPRKVMFYRISLQKFMCSIAVLSVILFIPIHLYKLNLIYNKYYQSYLNASDRLNFWLEEDAMNKRGLEIAMGGYNDVQSFAKFDLKYRSHWERRAKDWNNDVQKSKMRVEHSRKKIDYFTSLKLKYKNACERPWVSCRYRIRPKPE